MDYPFFIFQRVGLLENKYFNLALLIFGLTVVLLTVVFWPVGAPIRKHYDKPLALSPQEKGQRLWARIVCLLFVILFVGWLLAISQANDIAGINGLPPWVLVFGGLGLICSIGTIFVVVNALRSLKVPGGSGRKRTTCCSRWRAWAWSGS